MSKNKLWNFFIILSAVLLILPSVSIADDTPQLTQGQANHNNLKFGFRLTGGVFPLMRNDINDHLQGLNDIFKDYSDIDPNFIVNSEFEMIKMGMDFDGEILVSFMPNLSIGIGAGYISAGKETASEMTTSSTSSDTWTYDIKFSAIPITLSLYYGIPVGSSLQVVLNGGVGYYLGTVNFDFLSEGNTSSLTYEGTDEWSAKSNALGFHGGIDLEFSFARNLALVAGAKGRYVKLTDLAGTEDYDYNQSDGYSLSSTNEDMTLWYGNYKEGTKYYPQVVLSQNTPTGPAWSDVRKAEVNLSGIVFQAGIKITF